MELNNNQDFESENQPQSGNSGEYSGQGENFTEAAENTNINIPENEQIQPYNLSDGGEAVLQNIPLDASANTMRDYKKTCYKLGLYLICILALRIGAEGLSALVSPLLMNITDVDLLYAASLLYSALFMQILPSVLAVLMLKYSFKNIAGGFHPPKNSKKAFANFPAIYGAGMTINLITAGVMFLITGGGDINDTVNSLGIAPPTITSSLILFVLLVVVAPLFEEFIFRGAVMNLLKPYGGGVAIFVSAFCFGIYHGNFQQFFYAFALGILLGYVSYATNSMFCNTMLHAMFNSVSGILMILVSTDAVRTVSLDPLAELTDSQHLIITLYAIFMIAILITALIGFIAMIVKLKNIKKYRIPKVWGEVSNGKKMAILIFTLPVILSIILMIDIMGNNYISDFLYNTLQNI